MAKILIIEDDIIVANIYRHQLEREGFQVEVAPDGSQGLNLVRSFGPDLIILDLMLPEMSGIELIKQIRTQPEIDRLPIIVFSNTYLTGLVQDAWQAGATKCLSKSTCTPKHILELVRSTLPSDQSGKPAQPTLPHAPAAAPRPAQAHSPLPGQVELTDADAQFQADLRRSFIDGLPAALAAMRALLQAIVKGDNDSLRLKQTHDLYRHIHVLTGNAGLAGLMQISHLADALEALLKELYEKPKSINASTLRTVATAVDVLGILFDRASGPEDTELPAANILVVDDEAISRRALAYSLQKARLQSVNVEDPQAALRLLSERQFDLVFLDVDMPGMNGFELCSRLRAIPSYKRTPVVFVTSLTDFESRAHSTMSGGNDFIAKPFLYVELAVKALVYVLRGRLQPVN